jgi:hypothetical protein
MGGQIRKLTSGLEPATSEIFETKSPRTGSTRSDADEEEPEALVRKFVTQDKMHTFDSALMDPNEVERSDSLPQWISWAPDMSGRSLVLFLLMWFLTLESPMRVTQRS